MSTGQNAQKRVDYIVKFEGYALVFYLTKALKCDTLFSDGKVTLRYQQNVA